ncbi:hypothetical protein QTI38_04955 [Clostridium perfringens]|uniref:hypothetical protein n=1 Tax=Clostridium perfringens TaxID=1502 RepID=UPI0030D2F985|nr:hypothetical protein [Clostridium perfringens]MDM0837785.1 hypothetical protein [Clostridium perfringens]
MKIKVIYSYLIKSFNEGHPVITEDIIDINDETTLEDIFKHSNQENADVSRYYLLGGEYYFNQKKLPYIKKKDCSISWGVDYKNIKVLDFIFTHNIKDNTIYADTEIVQAGGRELKDIWELWNQYYPYIEQIVTTIGFIQIGYNFIKFIKDLFKDKKIEKEPPCAFLDLIFSKDEWNHYELAKNLEISSEQAKNFLKGFGYKWNKSKRLYINENNIEEIRHKFSDISIYKD